MSECSPCKPETYCPPGSSAEIPCPQGFYCGDEMEVPIPCPKGTYHNTDISTYLTSEADCTVCTEGYFCDGEGLFGTATDGPRDKCDPGPDLFYFIKKFHEYKGQKVRLFFLENIYFFSS